MSAGSLERDTAKKVKTDAKKSLNECIASEMILILPETSPAMNLSIIIIAFDMIEVDATNFFCVLISMKTIITSKF